MQCQITNDECSFKRFLSSIGGISHVLKNNLAIKLAAPFKYCLLLGDGKTETAKRTTEVPEMCKFQHIRNMSTRLIYADKNI